MTRSTRGSTGNVGGHGAPAWVEHMNAWLIRQTALIEKLESLVPAQERLACEGDRGALESLLNEREEIIRGLEHEQRGVEPVLRDWDMHLSELSAVERQALTHRVEAVAARVAGVLAAGARAHRALERRRDSLAEEISQLALGRGAAAAYVGGSGGVQATPSPRYQDHEA
jgi:hypothetical protein